LGFIYACEQQYESEDDADDPVADVICSKYGGDYAEEEGEGQAEEDSCPQIIFCS
jgi:hypothetical protein